MNKDLWMAVQTKLQAKGFYKLSIDGIPGKGTRDALRDYQKSLGLQPSNPPDARTLRMMGLEPLKQSELIVPPWGVILDAKMGLHELRDKAALAAFLKSDGSTLGDPSKLPWCFAGETEIMTEDGWQRLDNLTAQRVWQVDAAGRASLTAFMPVVKDYDAEAFRLTGPTVQVTCDVGHRWWGDWGTVGRDKRQQPERFGTLDDLRSGELTLRAPESGAIGLDVSDADLMMVAAFMSDGFMHRGLVEFAVSRQRKIDALIGMGPRGVYHAKRAYGPRTKTPLVHIQFDVPPMFAVAFDAYKHLRREFITGLSAQQLRTFLAAYAVFDGSVRAKDGRITLYTSDPQTRDDLETAAFLSGYWPTVEAGGSSNLTKKASYRVGFTPRVGKRKCIRRADVERVHFTGRMYCVTVPESRIIIRGADLSPVVTGNCGDLSETVTLNSGYGPVPSNPYLAMNWDKFGVGCAPAYYVYARFWRNDPKGTEGHIGFLVGINKAGTKYRVRGGNQQNQIGDVWIGVDRLVTTRKPTAYKGGFSPLPILADNGEPLSTNEA